MFREEYQDKLEVVSDRDIPQMKMFFRSSLSIERWLINKTSLESYQFYWHSDDTTPNLCMYKKLVHTALRYHSSLGWIVSDLARYFLAQWIVASLVTLAAPTLQAIAFLLLSSFVVSAARGTTIQARRFQLDFLQSGEISTVLIIAVICTGLLLMSATAKFFGEKILINLRFSYTEFNTKRAINSLKNHLHKLKESPVAVYRRLASLVRRDSIYCGRIATFIVSISAPLIEFIASALAAIWLYPLLTVAIGSVALLTVRFLHQISVMGNRHSLEQERYASEAGREVTEYLLDTSSFINNDRSLADILSQPLPKTEHWLYSLSGLLMVVPLSRLVTGILSGFVIGTIVIALGLSVGADQSSLSKALVYLIMLRYMVTSFQQIISYISCLNRFYSNAVRYRSLLRGEIPSDILIEEMLEDEDND